MCSGACKLGAKACHRGMGLRETCNAVQYMGKEYGVIALGVVAHGEQAIVIELRISICPWDLMIEHPPESIFTLPEMRWNSNND